MDADFTAGPGDSRPARQPGYRLTHPDAASPGTSPNPVLTGIDTGGHNGLGRNGQEQAAQWSSAPVTLRATPEPDALPRRLAPDLPQRSSDPDAVAARLASEGEPFTAGDSLYARTRPNSGSFTQSEPESRPFATAPAVEVEAPARPAVNGSPFGARIDADEDLFAATPAVEPQAPVSRRYAPDPEPPAQPAPPARLERMEAVAASLRETIEETPEPPAPAPSRRRAAPEPEPVAQDSTPPAAKAAEFRTSDATIDLHHIMRLLLASHELEVAATAAESGKADIEKLAQAAHRTRSAAVELVAAWYGGADHMRNFGEVLLQAAAETA